METAYFTKTGKALLLSEQNLIDCAWDYGNTGCLGGFQALAYNYMHDVLEIASEEVWLRLHLRMVWVLSYIGAACKMV